MMRVIVLSLSLFCGCAGGAAVLSGSKSCAEQVIPQAAAGAVDLALHASADDWKAKMAEAGVRYGLDLVKCVARRFLDPQFSGGGPLTAASADPAPERARQWIAEHGG